LIVQSAQTRDHSRATGYLHPRYAASLAEFGTLLGLASCGGWILEREIPGWPYHDAMGLYPLFLCRDWSLLAHDLAQLEIRLVSLSFVTDPFGDLVVDDLKHSFEVCFPYKEHYITNLAEPIEKIVSKGHQKDARRSLRKVSVESIATPQAYVGEWTQLYDELISRHHIRGIRRFSRRAFDDQLRVPGTVYFRVLYQGRLVGGYVYYLQSDVVYGHLAALTQEGYALGASYAAIWTAIEYFSGKATWVDHGGGAGANQGEADGLAHFKRGWAAETRPVYFCGHVLDRGKYAELAGASGMPNSTYFPIYRAGEFA